MSDKNTDLAQEVLAPVLDEIKMLGATSKENFDELNSNYVKLKSEIDKNGEKVDGLVNLKLDRLATDISARQEQIDKEFQEAKAKEEAATKRMDQLDLMIQRSGGNLQNLTGCPGSGGANPDRR